MQSKQIAQTIAVITTAAYLGFILLIGTSYCVYWLSMEPTAFMKDFQAKFPLFVPGAAVTLFPATLLTLWFAFKSKETPSARKSWIIAGGALLLVNAITMIYHIPVNLSFMGQKYSVEVATARLQLWVALHWLRIVLALVASVCVVQAFTKEVRAQG